MHLHLQLHQCNCKRELTLNRLLPLFLLRLHFAQLDCSVSSLRAQRRDLRLHMAVGRLHVLHAPFEVGENVSTTSTAAAPARPVAG